MDRTDVREDAGPAPGSDRRVPERLEDLPWVGRAIAAKLRLVGIESPADLIGRNPYELHQELSYRTGRRPDPCLLDVFIGLTRFIAGEPARPWWEYTAERKAEMDRRLAGHMSGKPETDTVDRTTET